MRSDSANITTSSTVSCAVSRPGITSTSFITEAGLKKCIPMTFAGRFVAAPISEIDRADVFEAKIAPSWQHRVQLAEHRPS